MNTVIAFYQTLGPALTLLVVITFLLAGTVKGVIGLGLPTIAMGLLGLAMPPAQAAALLIVTSGNWRPGAICRRCCGGWGQCWR